MCIDGCKVLHYMHQSMQDPIVHSILIIEFNNYIISIQLKMKIKFEFHFIVCKIFCTNNYYIKNHNAHSLIICLYVTTLFIHLLTQLKLCYNLSK